MRLLWDQTGERRFEAGVDRGVLYVEGSDGVAWNGLISVTENVAGGEATPYYIDGVKFLDDVANEDFQATIVAFTYPDEFSECDGNVEIDEGLIASQQPRARFGLSYRTTIGNDLEGLEYGYKIHFVYNATASPSDKGYGTLDAGGGTPTNFTWPINAVPELIPGHKPSAHLAIDSTKIDPFLLEAIEDALYGTATTPPRLLYPAELVELFDDWSDPISIIDHGDGTWSAVGPDANITMLDATTFQITDADAVFLDANTYEISGSS